MTTENTMVIEAGIMDLVGEGFTRESASAHTQSMETRGGSSFFKFETGNNIVRFLPSLKGESDWVVVVHQHFLRNWGGGTKPLVFNCPKRAGVGKCPACALADKMFKSDNPADHEAAKGYLPKVRAYARIIDRNNEGAGVQIVGLPKTLLERLIELRTNADEYGDDFTHPLDGDDILVVKKKDARGFWSYSANIAAKSKDKLHESRDQMVSWLSNAPDLQERGHIESFDAIVKRGDKLKAAVLAERGGSSDMAQRSVASSSSSADAVAELTASTVETTIGGQDGLEAKTPF